MQENKTMIEIIRERIEAFLRANGVEPTIQNGIQEEQNTEASQ